MLVRGQKRDRPRKPPVCWKCGEVGHVQHYCPEMSFSQDVQKEKSVGAIRSTRKLQLIYSDVVGPIQTESFGGHRYFVTFIDD